MKRSALLFLAVCLYASASAGGGVFIPTDSSQQSLFTTYKFILERAYDDYRFMSSTIDTLTFPQYGEHSVYWASSGPKKGNFVFPDVIPSWYSNISRTSYTSYNWQNDDYYSVQFKHDVKSVAIFKSSIKKNNNSVTWESIYFKNTFDSYLYNNMYYYVSEQDISAGIPSQTKLLIIPSFMLRDNDNKFYIDSLFAVNPLLKNRINSFLAGGGMIYAEGNAVYFVEKLGYLAVGAVNFNNSAYPDTTNNLLNVAFTASANPVGFTKAATGNRVYAISVPFVQCGSAEVIATCPANGSPLAFLLKGTQANGGRILCNTALPTVGGVINAKYGSRQLAWTFNSIFFAYAKRIGVTRSLVNDLVPGITAGRNAIAYDAVDTFRVIIKLRNLSSDPVTISTLYEDKSTYLSFAGMVTPGLNFYFQNNRLTITNVYLAPHSELNIIYRLKTPLPTDPVHANINNYIWWATYFPASYNYCYYTDNDGYSTFMHYRNYVDIMFSAKIVADADLNWKNFLGTYYQPFKIFMIMENKERTKACNTFYTQYVPKDVPFYWTDQGLDIPILRTPGGKYVDVLKGSNNQNSPQYDMNGNGHPDAWLDTASIYPKGYTLTEDSVYWLNPWHRLATGDSMPYYEDIDHDGLRAQDPDRDDTVEVQEPGDKIRVWKITWNVHDVPGYMFYDPYCYFELWVDPPDLVAMSAGVGNAYGTCSPVSGMFYPNAPDIASANLADTTWKHWMERDASGNIVYKQLIYQSNNNYEGYVYIDTAAQNYQLTPSDYCVGTVPVPHNEYIAVLSMGGEEIDMNNSTPKKSLYSNIDYKTIFNEPKKTPMRTTYTYYAPLPNPLQFEYLSNTFTITDSITHDTLKNLPASGSAKLTFEVDASTEYSYYWIRNAGHDVDFNDPSLAMEGAEALGDGVFGYLVYDIPKGMGGYNIYLPKRANGTYNTAAIVQGYQRWIDNPNTRDSVEIWEDQFQYHVMIPQLLIPPALDDDNLDGVEDWIDDRGDRFCSPTGFLHDAFPLGNGEEYPDYPPVPFQDDIYGMVDSGWYAGPDGTYGDDLFEKLGKVHFNITAYYHGRGREGPVEISKGGTLVVEEIFGGSPWVVFSHTISGYAEGLNYRVQAQSTPSMVNVGTDTTFIKYTIEDLNEPHSFDINYDPWLVAYGRHDVSATSYTGGKDPCSLISPAYTMSAVVDPGVDHRTITLLPLADTSNPTLAGYPRTASGTFLEARVELINGSDDNFLFTSITPQIPANLGSTHVEMSYVAYPRPLVPAAVDPATGEIIHAGDNFGTFTTGWRFNQPDGEVIVKLGDTLNLIQPTRHAYYNFLFSIDETRPNNVYSIGFRLSGFRKHYDGTGMDSLHVEVPDIRFSITDKDAHQNVLAYQKFVIGQGSLNQLAVNAKPCARGLESVKWSLQDVSYLSFDALPNLLPASYSSSQGKETIDLSAFNRFPAKDTTRFYVLEKMETTSTSTGADMDVTTNEVLGYSFNSAAKTYTAGKAAVTPVGPQINTSKKTYSVNGHKLVQGDTLFLPPQSQLYVVVNYEATNAGNDISTNTVLRVDPGPYFVPVMDSMPPGIVMENGLLKIQAGSVIPGETRKYLLHFMAQAISPDSVSSLVTIVDGTNGNYRGEIVATNYSYTDPVPLQYRLYFPLLPDFDLYSFTSVPGQAAYSNALDLRARSRGGVVRADSVMFRMYVILGNDTVPVQEGLVNFDGLHETELLRPGFTLAPILDTLPYAIDFLKFYAKIDAGNAFTEASEANNARILTVPVSPLYTSLSGPCYYDNDLQSPLDSLRIYLVSGAGTVKDSVWSDHGSYEMSNVRPGTYHLEADYDRSWGGVNSTDALKILYHFTGMNPLEGLRLAAADLDGNSIVNSNDALLAVQRFVNFIPGFPAEDWVFSYKQFTLIGPNPEEIYIAGLCRGDVNGSYIPSGGRMALPVALNHQGQVLVEKGTMIDLPVSVKNSLSCNAVSLVFSFPQDILQPDSVYPEMKRLSDGMAWHVSGNQLRIGWYGPEPLQAEAGEVLFHLVFRTGNPGNLQGRIEVALLPLSEFAGEDAVVMNGVELEIPDLFAAGPGELYLGGNFPNPFRKFTTIQYSLPEEGKVILELYNFLGSRIKVLDEAIKKAGNYSFTFDGTSLAPGMYLYHLDFSGRSGHSIQSGSMVRME